jgi:hypothetical protein
MRIPRVPRIRLSRRQAIVAAGAGVGVIALALSFGPIARGKLMAEAARRHLDVHVGSVRPGWFAVGLKDVTVQPVGAPGVRVHVGSMDVGLSATLHPSEVVVRDGDVSLEGSVEELKKQIETWRGSEGADSEGGGGRKLRLRGERFALEWKDGGGGGAELRDMGFTRDGDSIALNVGELTGHHGGGSVWLKGASIVLGKGGQLQKAHATEVEVEWTMGHARQSAAKAESVADKQANPGAPLIPLPDLHELRSRAAVIASALSGRIPDGADLAVTAMTWKIARDGEHEPLTIGPGPLEITRADGHFEVKFAADAHAQSTSLTARALLPVAGGDVTATLEGGPVALSQLGIHEGAAGLADVDRATLTGKSHAELAGDGSALTFDMDLSTRGLSIREPRLASDVVRGVDMQLRARGALDDQGELRLDDLGATFGVLHLDASGMLDQKPDHVAAAFRFELPSASCQALLDSMPTALLPALQGTRMSGTFGARGRFAFDTRKLQDLDLGYDIQDQCRITQVPPELAQERFSEPFSHRIYLPDGTVSDMTTGPDTPNWTPLDQISPYMQIAVLTTEDGAFPRHHGFNHAAIRASIIANLEARRFVRGASTITMQLAKNLFLSRDKTLARKLEEVVLTDYMEQAFSKDEIMELYLNVIEFGPAVYGITQAAEYYFGRAPSELDLAECYFLASLLPSPLRYGAMRDGEQVPESWMKVLKGLMQIAHKRGLVSDADLTEGLTEVVTFWHGGVRPPPRPPVHLRTPIEGDDQDAPAVIDGSQDAP